MLHSHICVHYGIKDALSGSDRVLRSQFQRAIESLESGSYSHGIWVKKLHGAREQIFEARLNQKERLLFDFNRRYCQPCNAVKTYTRLLDYVPDHDAVNRRARRLNRKLEEAFFDTWDEVTREEQRITVPRMGSAQTGQPIGSRQLDLIELQSLLGFAGEGNEILESGIQWYQVDDPNFWKLIEEGSAELKLILTEDQAHLLTERGPLLINGSAGSGKTTLAVYRLLRRLEENPALRALYVTYNPRLAHEAEDLGQKIFGQLPVAEQIGTGGVLFSTFSNLCIKIIHSALRNQALHQYRLVGFLEFRNWLNDNRQRRAVLRNLNPVLVWDELRGVIRGSWTANRKPAPAPFLAAETLSLEEYLKIGDKASRVLRADDKTRRQIYSLAEEYQNYLAAGKLYDEQGLAWEALRRTQSAQFDVVIADEIQDLTEIELEVLVQLSQREQRGSELFFVGDLQQVINPSSFRWENVNNLFYRHEWEKTRLKSLSFNFRNRPPVVRLANKLLELRKEAVGLYADETSAKEPAGLMGELPCLCIADEQAVLKQLRQMDFAGIDIITATEDDRQRVIDALGDGASVITIQDAKGLDLREVLLWNIGAPFQKMWKDFYTGDDKAENPKSEVAYAYNLMYVAVTRVRRQLVIFEAQRDTFPWKMIEPHLLDAIAVEDIDRYLIPPKTAAEWNERGDYFLSAEIFDRAMLAFQRANNPRKEKITQARMAAAKYDFETAASLWQEVDEWAEAAKCWQEANQPAMAAQSWEMTANKEDAARQWEQAGELLNAARIWESLENWGEAARCYERTGHRSDAGRCKALRAESQQAWGLAANEWEKISHWNEAARCFRAGGELQESGRCEALGYEHKGQWEKAAMGWEDLKAYPKAVRCYQEAGLPADFTRCQALDAEAHENWEPAAGYWQKLNQWDKAALCYRRAGNPVQEATAQAHWAELEGRFMEAAFIWEGLEKWDSAGGCYTQAGDAESALRCQAIGCEAESNWHAAGSTWMRLQKWEKAVHCYRQSAESALESFCQAKLDEEQGDWETAAEIWERLQEWVFAGECYARLGRERDVDRCRALLAQVSGDLRTAAGLWEKIGAWEDAVRVYTELGDLRAVSRVEALRFEENQEWAAAADKWAEIERWKNAADAYDLAGNLEQSLICQALYREATRDWFEAGKLWEGSLRWLDAARCYEQANEIGHAIRCRANQAEERYLWAEAAAYWETVRDWRRSAMNYRRAGQFADFRRCLAEVSDEGQNWRLAANRWETLSKWDRAARSWGKSGEWELSSMCWETAARPERAAVCWKKGGFEKDMVRTLIERAHLQKDLAGEIRLRIWGIFARNRNSRHYER